MWDDEIELRKQESLYDPVHLEGRSREELKFSNRSILNKGVMKRGKGLNYELRIVQFNRGKKCVKMNRMWKRQLEWGHDQHKSDLLGHKFKKNMNQGLNAYDSSKYYKIGTRYGRP